MQKSAIVLVAVIVIAVVIYALTRPEPTPAERLSEAAEDAGEAAKDAVEELAAVAEDAVDTLQENAEAKAQEIQNDAAATADALATELVTASEEARSELEVFINDWRESGIVTDEGIDYDAAIAAVNAADMDAKTKEEVNRILAYIRDLPGEAQRKLQELENAL